MKTNEKTVHYENVKICKSCTDIDLLCKSDNGLCGFYVAKADTKLFNKSSQVIMVRDGDRIKLDIPNRKLELLVDDTELAERKKSWQAPEPKIKSGWLARYAKVVTSANTGAICEA